MTEKPHGALKPVNQWINWFKPRSNAWRTTILVSTVSFFSLAMSLVLFWRTLYLPELRQHAESLATEIRLLKLTDQYMPNDPFLSENQAWLLQRTQIEIIEDPTQFPALEAKVLANLFTNTIEDELEGAINEPVTAYFKFKPTPTLWIHYDSLGEAWLKEPLKYYADYSIEVLMGWLVGIPLLTVFTILLLVRQLNRPLSRLQQAALSFTRFGKAKILDTSHGAIEIRQVNKAFNAMLDNIKKTDQERKLMLAGISHDLRTPLTRMRISAEMLDDEGELKSGFIDDIDDMDDILQQFIAFVRYGTDEAFEITDLQVLIEELLQQLKPIEVQFSYEAHLPAIHIRPLSIKRVLINLVTNATKYGAPPYVISLSRDISSSENQLAAGEHLKIIVSDAGTSPSMDTGELFKPFVRGNQARSTQGSGLGLSIVQRIIHSHFGSVNIETPHGGGFHVIIHLPLNVH